MQVISVVRNFAMYTALVKNNIYYTHANFIALDNSVENKHVSTRYNEFLDAYDFSQPDWFVFCHEDWELKEHLHEKLEKLHKNHLYGPIGCIFDFPEPHKGQIFHSDKNGENVEKTGEFVEGYKEVGTFDCQCLIVHSSLIQKYSLRFDEELAYDLYVEDFCINAREKHNIGSKVVQITSQHWSKGEIGSRFKKQLDYLKKKYTKTQHSYYVTCSSESIGKSRFALFFKAKRFIVCSLSRKIGKLFNLSAM